MIDYCWLLAAGCWSRRAANCSRWALRSSCCCCQQLVCWPPVETSTPTMTLNKRAPPLGRAPLGDRNMNQVLYVRCQQEHNILVSCCRALFARLVLLIAMSACLCSARRRRPEFNLHVLQIDLIQWSRPVSLLVVLLTLEHKRNETKRNEREIYCFRPRTRTSTGLIVNERTTHSGRRRAFE